MPARARFRKHLLKWFACSAFYTRPHALPGGFWTRRGFAGGIRTLWALSGGFWTWERSSGDISPF